MALSKLPSEITKSQEDFQDILNQEKDNFENKFINLKERVGENEGDIKASTQKGNGNENIDDKKVDEDLQLELKDVNQKLQNEELKNKELEQDIDDLNALVDLYLKEAQKRDGLEEEYREKATQKLKLTIKHLEEEVLYKIGEINNLENTVTELRRELNEKNEEIANLNKQLTICCKV